MTLAQFLALTDTRANPLPQGAWYRPIDSNRRPMVGLSNAPAVLYTANPHKLDPAHFTIV